MQSSKNTALTGEPINFDFSFDRCLNQFCPDFQQKGKNNLRKYGRNRKGTQRYQCKTCMKTFTETLGTIFHGCHYTPSFMSECLAMLGDRSSLAAVRRVKHVREETLLDWLEKAAKHSTQMENYFLTVYSVSRMQVDGLWTYVWNRGKKGVMTILKIVRKENTGE